MPGRYRLLADVTPLRESAAFRRLWAGTTLSALGGALAGFAVILQVYELTRSPFAVGLVGVAQMVPTLVVGLLGGPARRWPASSQARRTWGCGSAISST